MKITDKKTATNSFRLHTKNDVTDRNMVEPYYYPELQSVNDTEIKKFFRNMLKVYNTSRSKSATGNRKFIKIEREYIIRLKDRVINKYIKI